MNLEEMSRNGKYLCKIDKYNEAKEYFEKILSIDENHIESYYDIIHCSYMMKDYECVEKYCNKIISINKKEGRAYWILSVIEYQIKGNLEKSLNYINRAIYYDFSNEYIYNAKGTLLEKKKRYEDAIKCYDRALYINPAFYKARIKKAAIYQVLNKYNEALQCYDEIILHNPEIVDGYHLKFVCLIQRYLYIDAEELLFKAINKIGKEDIFVKDFIELYKIKGEYDKALFIIKDSYDKYKNKIDILTDKAIILELSGNIKEAIEILEGIDKDKYNDKIIYYLSSFYMKNNEYKKASELLYKLIISDYSLDNYKYIALYEYPLSLKLQGNHDDARKYFEIAIKQYKMFDIINPTDRTNKILRVLSLKHIQKYEEAIEYIDYMLSIDDKWADAYALKGSIYKLKGNIEKGLEYIDIAKSISPNINIKYLDS